MSRAGSVGVARLWLLAADKSALWSCRKLQNTVAHWHYLGNSTLKMSQLEKEARLNEGVGAAVGAEFFTFWVNQDTKVDIDEYCRVLQVSVKNFLTFECFSKKFREGLYLQSFKILVEETQ
jgi:hypothetical protein